MKIWKYGKGESFVGRCPMREKDIDLSEEQMLQNSSSSIAEIS
jgi:hypothetical protein